MLGLELGRIAEEASQRRGENQGFSPHKTVGVMNGEMNTIPFTLTSNLIRTDSKLAAWRWGRGLIDFLASELQKEK